VFPCPRSRILLTDRVALRLGVFLCPRSCILLIGHVALKLGVFLGPRSSILHWLRELLSLGCIYSLLAVSFIIYQGRVLRGKRELLLRSIPFG